MFRDSWKNHQKLKFFYYAFFMDWRHLWTLPVRKQVTRSSSFPSTITTPNSKPISQTIEEFWKRYHPERRAEAEAERWFRIFITSISFLLCYKFKVPSATTATIFMKDFLPGLFWYPEFRKFKKKI
jgi:hypothetical protein